MKLKILKITLVLSFLISILTISTSAHAANAVYSWTNKANVLENRTGGAAVSYQGKIYLFGGTSGDGIGTAYGTINNTTYEYDPTKDQWTLKKPMPTPRSAVSAVVLHDKIYVIGGYNKVNGIITRLTTVEIYDPSTDSWITGTSLSSPRAWVGLGVYEGTIYVFGGMTNNNIAINTTESFNSATNMWSTKSPVPVAGGGLGVVQHDGKFFITGQTNNAFWSYNPTNDTWSSFEPNKFEMPGMVIKNNEIHVLGSYESSNVNVYNLKTNEWSTPYTLSSLKFHIQTAILNNEIYVVGGTTGQAGGISAITEKLNINPLVDESDRAILVITMTNGLEKEYDLSMAEVNAFIQWYDDKDQGIGPAKYAFIKTWNMGPFKARTEYVIFDKILTFEVGEYDIEE
jgi:N-acetylneuraminic acid mutarotase